MLQIKTIIPIILCLAFFSSCNVTQKKAIHLKIMSYNIRHGVGLDTILDLSRSAKIINANALDLCGLQEIDQFCSRSDSISQTNYLSKETNMEGTFGKFMSFQGGAYGMATLSSKPLVSTKILTLPDAIYEPRSSIVHEVKITEDYNIIFANVHFDWINDQEGSSRRLSQAKALVNYIDTLNKTAIITGDFNCTPDSPTMKYFAEQGFLFVKKGEDNLSFQGKIKTEIDHLIYRGSHRVIVSAKSVKLIKEPIASDHRPLIVELEISYN